MKSVIPVVLSGGTGTRMWPLSRTNYPKQFLKLASEQNSLLQETIMRLPESCEKSIVVCNESHRFVVAEQLLNIDYSPKTILLEPESKNTAPAIAIAAFSAMELDPNAILLIISSDHSVKNVDDFHKAIASSIKLAKKGYLVTFGVKPSSPETGYGYIKRGDAIDTLEPSYLVSQFIEKPNLETAKDFITSDKFLWNSGIFMFKAASFLEELKKYVPEIYESSKSSAKNQSSDLDFTRIDCEAFAKCPSESIDYAVMEKTNKAVVIPVDIGWSDIGTWSGLWNVLEKDQSKNSCIGDIIAVDSYDNYLHSSHKLVAAIGVNNLAVIETKDAILISDKNKSQDIKLLINEMKKAGRSELLSHRVVYRPWGKYDTIDEGTNFKVKRITVNPGERLSLQRHKLRAEHWVVVSGTAKVKIENKELLLAANQSTYIPIGSAHSLENPYQKPLEIIEVQTGVYTEEDDVIRLEDKYGRTQSNNNKL